MTAAQEKESPRQCYARGEEMQIGLTTDDVLLVPRPAPETDTPRDLSSRENVDTSTFITKGATIKLSIPIVSAPMADVTGAKLAIALAKEGGVGIIHRGQTAEEEATQVREVKGKMAFVFERPPTLPKTATVFESREAMNRIDRGIVVVTDDENRVIGLVTNRDVKKGVAPQDFPLGKVMTPRQELIMVTSDIDTHNPQEIFVRQRGGKKVKATDLMWKNRIEKLVVVDHERRLKGVISDYDLRQYREHPAATIDQKGELVVGAAIGINGNYLKRAEKVIAAGANFLCIDVANGYLETARRALKILKKRFPNIPIMIGSIATREGAKILSDEGADSLRVGIGSGSICITRGVSGFGFPGLSAALETADEADKYGVPVVADGGVRNSSDMAKYLAAGARAVMLGKLLAQAEEAEGSLIIDENLVRFHEYRGMASESVRRQLEMAEKRKYKAYTKKPEGVPKKVRIVGTVFDITKDLVGGLRSGMTYGGVTNLEQLRDEVDFVRVTSAGQKESAVQDF